MAWLVHVVAGAHLNNSSRRPFMAIGLAHVKMYSPSRVYYVPASPLLPPSDNACCCGFVAFARQGMDRPRFLPWPPAPLAIDILRPEALRNYWSEEQKRILKNKKKKKTAAMKEPILSRLDCLDNILKQLMEIRGRSYHSPKSSTASTAASSVTLTSTDDFSPKSLEKHYRPIDDVMLETEIKGTLIERLVDVEDHVFRLCLQIGAELESENKKKEGYDVNVGKGRQQMPAEKKSPNKSFKHFVRSCVRGKGKDKSQQL
ncbi:hypothetical protein M9H77_02361 [Catharanthus roseus]|uniref:Uncharacterized protein n=1 Tax=Catharanthus roseus TaxID=4058 RepID=A0ACC0C8L3_CATRO|nr:hypothetical protein M9H77_02361 [Catharanthus roseus]